MDDGILPTGFPVGSSDSSSWWYQRLGHSSFQSLRLVLPATSTISRISCKSCGLSNHHHALYCNRVNKCSSVPFELVYYMMFGALIVFLLSKISSIFLQMISLVYMVIYVKNRPGLLFLALFNSSIKKSELNFLRLFVFYIVIMLWNTCFLC